LRLFPTVAVLLSQTATVALPFRQLRISQSPKRQRHYATVVNVAKAMAKHCKRLQRFVT